jgi:putative membrane protein
MASGLPERPAAARAAHRAPSSPRRPLRKVPTMDRTRRSLLLLALGSAACQERAVPPLAAADEDFIRQATASGLGQVALGQLAASRVSSPAVRQFAQRMVAECGVVNRELGAIARRRGVTPPTAPDPERAEATRRLSTLTGPAFERGYMAQQMREHEWRLALFRRQARSGADPEVRAFAEKYLPVVEAHARMAEAVLDSVAAAEG